MRKTQNSSATSTVCFFMTRKPQEGSVGASQPGQEDEGGEDSTALASEEETGRGILSVLQLRHEFLRSKGIADMSHVFTKAERSEFTSLARQTYEESEEQRILQDRDRETYKGLAKGKGGEGKRNGDAGSGCGAFQLAADASCSDSRC